MPPEGEVRTAMVSARAVPTAEVVVLPIPFGVGRRDHAVRLHQIMYTVTQFDNAETTAFQDWMAALDEDPEHERTPPVGGIFENIQLPNYYAVGYRQSQRFSSSGLGHAMQMHSTMVIPLHGLLRPYRQRVTYFNETDGANQFRAEILYSPVSLPDEDLRTLDRTYGSVRRS